MSFSIIIVWLFCDCQ